MDLVTCLDTHDSDFVFSHPNLLLSVLATQKHWSRWSLELPGAFGHIDKPPEEVKREQEITH